MIELMLKKDDRKQHDYKFKLNITMQYIIVSLWQYLSKPQKSFFFFSNPWNYVTHFEDLGIP